MVSTKQACLGLNIDQSVQTKGLEEQSAPSPAVCTVNNPGMQLSPTHTQVLSMQESVKLGFLPAWVGFKAQTSELIEEIFRCLRKPPSFIAHIISRDTVLPQNTYFWRRKVIPAFPF